MRLTADSARDCRMCNGYAEEATALRLATPRRYTISEAKNPQMAANVREN